MKEAKRAGFSRPFFISAGFLTANGRYWTQQRSVYRCPLVSGRSCFLLLQIRSKHSAKRTPSVKFFAERHSNSNRSGANASILFGRLRPAQVIATEVQFDIR